jgi:lipid-binding SYLF domain-containing protein
MKNRLTLLALGMYLLGIIPMVAQDAETSQDLRLQNSTTSFHEAMQAPDKGIPHDLFEKARCAVIIPGVKKPAFIVGGKYGRGFVSCRANGIPVGSPKSTVLASVPGTPRSKEALIAISHKGKNRSCTL